LVTDQKKAIQDIKQITTMPVTSQSRDVTAGISISEDADIPHDTFQKKMDDLSTDILILTSDNEHSGIATSATIFQHEEDGIIDFPSSPPLQTIKSFI